jgi:hypothetical protein
MVTSYNGWLASKNPADFGGLEALVVDGESFAPGVRAGDVHDVFEYLATQMDLRVEPIYAPGWHTADEWGYYYKPSANSPSLLSCHSSGTAIDYNATRHPNGKRGTYTAAQVATIRQILAELEGIVYWGGDAWGNGTPDEMHFEIKTGVSAAAVARVAAKIRANGGPARQLGQLPSAPPGVLKAGSTLTANQYLRSGIFRAVMQADGNFVVYRDGVGAVWSTRTQGHPGARIVMQTDGNLVVYGKDNKALWNSRTQGKPGCYLAMQSDGNLVIYQPVNKAVWSLR